ncbi:hypothetical protein BGX29_001405 [Mortierella sp. GBA35]|nr:hypothetical protein BGX23_012772 [Mortierella sp. AD031]KAF9104723.1 hypothetical protein BGX29_001405 [Mortierella sp. GBA35]KAG0212020.1 hypothetical protein BGX33_003907 [Mortierella sp. NVP41]
MAPPRVRRGGKKLPPGAGRTAAEAKKRQAEAEAAAAMEKNPQVLDPDNESGDATVSMEVDQESQDAKAWIKQNVDQEVARIRATGTAIEPMAVKNFGIVVDLSRKKALAINRIEVDTKVDFKKVQQIMVSPGIPYPHKDNFEYVNVLLFTDSTETPMLVPYLYDTKYKTQEPLEDDDSLDNPSTAANNTTATAAESERPWIPVKNNLTEWLLVNSLHQRAKHHIDEFHDI